MAHVTKYILNTLLFVMTAAACTAPIELNTNDSEPVIVIYGTLTEYVAHQIIRITGSSPYFEEKHNQSVSGAAAEIRTSDGRTFEMEEIPGGNGYYQTVAPMAAIPGITYRLIVEVDFNHDGTTETYEATTTMPPPFQLDSIKIETVDIMGYRHYSLNMYALEDPSEDYYLARYILNDTLTEYQISNFIVFSDMGINNQYINGLVLMYFEDIENMNSLVGDSNESSYVRPGDKITLCISRIEKKYYEFIRQCQSEKRGENPFFGGPASNIATNISHGGVGYFAAFSTTAADVYVP